MATTRVPQPNFELVSIYEQNKLLRKLAEECRVRVCHRSLNIHNRRRCRCVHPVDTELQKICNLGHCAPNIKFDTRSCNGKPHNLKRAKAYSSNSSTLNWNDGTLKYMSTSTASVLLAAPDQRHGAGANMVGDVHCCCGDGCVRGRRLLRCNMMQ